MRRLGREIQYSFASYVNAVDVAVVAQEQKLVNLVLNRVLQHVRNLNGSEAEGCINI